MQEFRSATASLRADLAPREAAPGAALASLAADTAADGASGVAPGTAFGPLAAEQAAGGMFSVSSVLDDSRTLIN